ncbi:hypothetical protein PMT9312_1339 [Prochlorococcus marinus str. MIT 9312]|uniref:Uncharacterized protein n=2 Tax=Prochlorococcaceae TaxID=2881426 RepID=Q319P6_PROM9|nr:hypothetical protein PMT9312_1339 [Prochlorococcus marinus str. MIT 9312]
MHAYIWWASLLAKDNFKNFVISTSSISIKKINQIKPNAIIWSYARPQNAFLIQYSYLKGIKNIIHDTEGITYRCDKEYSDSCDNLTLKCIHGIWGWGEEQKKLINNRCAKIGHKLVASNIGSIRYEYYKNLKISRKKNNKILINTNFPIIDPRYGSLESDYKIWVNIEKKLSKIEFIKRCIELSAMRQSLINFVKELIDKNLFKPKDIILRTHPFESDNYYRDLKGLGVEISNKNDIAYDISRSFLMAQCGCQTVLDGLIQDVPSILIKPSFENIWSDLSSQIDTDYLQKLNEDKNEYYSFKKRNIKSAKKIVTPFLSNIEKQINYELLISNLFEPLKKNKILFFYTYFFNLLIRISKNLKDYLRFLLYPRKILNKKLTNEILIKYMLKKKIPYSIDSNNNIYLD